jgi:hypothetical protein
VIASSTTFLSVSLLVPSAFLDARVASVNPRSSLERLRVETTRAESN